MLGALSEAHPRRIRTPSEAHPRPIPEPSDQNSNLEASKVASDRPLSHSEAPGLGGGTGVGGPRSRDPDLGYICTRIFARASRALDSPDS